MLVLEGEDADLFARLQEKNLARQYDLLTAFVEIGLKQGPTALDKYALWALNHVAVAGISQFGGRFREQPIYVGNHIPPHFKEVPQLMDQFISFIHENWFNLSSTQLAAYGLWRLNWVHPFIEGNGRTARATCYYFCVPTKGGCSPGGKLCRSGSAKTAIRTFRHCAQPIAHGMRVISTSAKWRAFLRDF